MAKPIYVARGETGEIAIDARNGAQVPAPNEATIRKLAMASYTGREPIASTALITDIPGEIRGRKPPLWRVEFDHWNKPTFYLSPVTGELLSRRHELWRIFDFVWMLHIMDYDERENVNNLLLRIFTWGAVLMALSGIWMLFYSFPEEKEEEGGGRMTVKSIWLRKIHKWIGLVIGLQFLLWAISGTAMALLDMDEVAGGEMAEHAEPAPLPRASDWATVQRRLGDERVEAMSLRELPGRNAIQ